ncbi:MAG: cache domain-containing protein [Bacteroidota bacterium]
MKKPSLIPPILAFVLWFSCGSLVSAQQGKYRYAETNRIVDMVNDAAALIRQSGEAAFATLIKRDSRWSSNQSYIFVIDIQGRCYVHQDTSLVGKSIYDVKDPNGKPFVQWFIRKALGPSQSGWTHYRWVKQGDTLPSWRTTFTHLVNAPSGKIYIVGAGSYNLKMEKAFVVEALDDAVILVRQMGVKAFPLLRDKGSEFVFKDTYVFVVDSSYKVLVNPAFPGEEGQNVYDLKDVNGKYFFRELFQVAGEKGSGWVDYVWPKPGEARPSPKSTYVRKIVVKGSTYLVGSGIYPE